MKVSLLVSHKPWGKPLDLSLEGMRRHSITTAWLPH